MKPCRAWGSGEGGSPTYFGRAAFDLGHFSASAAVGLLMVELQVLQALGQSQLLLDSHTEEGVQRLLLIFGRCQLPLHFIKLCDVLVTSNDEEKEGEKEQQR